MENNAATQTKVPNEKGQEYPKYRWLILVMVLFVSMLDLFLLTAVAPIMTSLMETFNTDMTTIGFASTIVSTLSGLFMFITAIVVGVLNVKKSFVFATASLLLGNVICYLSTGVGMFILGRAFVGIGFGLSGALVAATVFMWFPAKARPMIFTANALSTAVVQVISFNIIVPIYTATGRWQSIFMLCIVLSAVALVAWLFLGKDFDINTGGAPAKGADRAKIKPFDGLIQAMKSKQEWLIAIPATMTMLSLYAIIYYFPTYLSTVVGLSQAAASSVTSVMFIAGIVGTLGGGVLATAIGKRKIILVIGNFASAIAGIALFLVDQVPLLITVMAIFAISRNIRAAAMQSASLEVEGMTPAMGAGASSMLFGFGSFVTLILSPLMTALINAFGFTSAMMILSGGIMFIGGFVSLFMKDSGPKAKVKG